MPERISIHVLGAGCEVGRSCFVITIAGKSILVDAGVHMNPSSPEDRIPIIPDDIRIHAVFITHYHLDHIGALPYLTEVVEKGPLRMCDNIYMTAPTALLAPPIMIDYCKGGSNTDIYLPNHVHRLFDKVKLMPLNHPIRLEGCNSFVVTPFYVGHVLGGVGLLIQYRGVSVVYTGDFSVAQDSLLRPINVPVMSPPRGGVDVVISEATHATTVNSRTISSIEHELCERIRNTLGRGGKVLVPIFAVGRTQELAAIIRRRLGYKVKLFTTSGSGQRACTITTTLMRSWSSWEQNTDQGDLRVSFLPEDSPFPDEPCVVFSSPAMIEGGSSLRLFQEICGDWRNLVVLTGYCSRETVGNSVILFASRNVRKREIEIHGKRVKVNCECLYTPFSNHTDSVGIESVIRQLVPRNLVLIHGEKSKMEAFKARLEGFWGHDVRIDIPRNYEVLTYDIAPMLDVSVSSRPISIRRRIKSSWRINKESANIIHQKVDRCETMEDDGTLIVSRSRETVRVVTVDGQEIVAEYMSLSPRGLSEWAAYNSIFSDLSDLFERGTDDNYSISECSA